MVAANRIDARRALLDLEVVAAGSNTAARWWVGSKASASYLKFKRELEEIAFHTPESVKTKKRKMMRKFMLSLAKLFKKG